MSWGYDLIHDANRNWIWRLVTRYTLKHSDVMIGDCNTIRQLAISYGMPDERIVTFPWGIDLRKFTPAPGNDTQNHGISGAKNPPFTLLSTRGWEPIYGVDVIAKAFVLAARQHPELHLLMLGNGSLSAELRQAFINGGVQDQVLFPGQVSQSDLPRMYRSTDLYVSASHSDGSSISLLEAMACGLPAIVSDIPGNREWITHGKNGWLFSDGNVDALAQAILDAVKEQDKLPEMGLAARKLVEQRADWEMNFQELLGAYELAFQATG
jgi:glycosyltransferase involved in cell wall biosynthesis